MNTLVGILFNTRRTFQKLDNEFSDDLNVKATIIFFIVGLGTGIKSILEEWNFVFGPSIWTTTLLLLLSGLIGLVFGRYILSPVLFGIGKTLRGKAEFIDVMVVTAYSMIPTLIEVPIAIYKVLATKEEFTNFDYIFLNGLHLISWGLSIKILIQGLRDFNEFGTMKAVINVSPMIVLPILLYLVYYLAL
jgi:hypothetical protein